ncbi:MAG: addiction module antidote protein [Magnetococcus sp. YQC-5]
MKDRSHDEAMAEMYRDDPVYAMQLLNDILEEGDQGELLIMLRQLAIALGGVQGMDEKECVNTYQLLCKLPSECGSALGSLFSILKVMGLRLAVLPVSASPGQMGSFITVYNK